MSDDVLYERSGAVATITLNRPDKLNAVTTSMIGELVAAFDETDADDAVRAVIVTGSGRAYCAGAELGGADAVSNEGAPAEQHRDSGGLFTTRVWRSRKPVIAAINGSAVGFGISMTLPMDFRVVSDDAKLGFVFAARGIVPDGAASWFLPKIVGLPTALDWCLTGRRFTPEEALAAGLVRSVHPQGQVLDAAHAIAGQIATDVAPVSAALTRSLLLRGTSEPTPFLAHRLESRSIPFLGRGADAAEGVSAFLERRAPQWTQGVSTDAPEWFPWLDDEEFHPYDPQEQK